MSGGAQLAKHVLKEAAPAVRGDHLPCAHSLRAHVGDQEEMTLDRQLLCPGRDPPAPVGVVGVGLASMWMERLKNG